MFCSAFKDIKSWLAVPSTNCLQTKPNGVSKIFGNILTAEDMLALQLLALLDQNSGINMHYKLSCVLKQHISKHFEGMD